MKLCKRCNVEKPNEQFSKSSRETDGLQDRCKPCNSEVAAEYRAANIDKEKVRHRKYAQENRERVRKYHKTWGANNTDKINEKARIFYQRNKNKSAKRMSKWKENPLVKEHLKKYMRQYQKNNRGRINSIAAKRHALKKQAIPVWADINLIEKFYSEAVTKTKQTGIEHSVDHIIPLNSNIVCGLHCQQNLRVIIHVENIKKGNRFWPDCP